MKGKNLILIIGFIILAGILLFVITIQNNKNNNSQSDNRLLIEKKLNLKLPSNSKILNFDSPNKYGEFAAKILINSEDLTDIKKQLNSHLGEKANPDVNPDIRHFENVIRWWDLDKTNIDKYYFKFITGGEGEFMSMEAWVFITKEKDGQRLLYISY